MYEIIHDEEQVRQFYRECLPRLKPTEVYFISMAARNKYLDDAERERYNLGRTEMYAKTIIRHDTEDEFVKHIRRLECDERGYTTRTGEPIPQKCMVCYANIDPSSTPKALQSFMQVVNEYYTEAMAIVTGNNNGDNFVDRLNKIDNNLLSCYQQAHAKGKWIDIDIDLSEEKTVTTQMNVILTIKCTLVGLGIDNYKIVATRSGYHVLVGVEEIKFNPVKILDALKVEMLAEHIGFKEIEINKNRMIPVPGTLQAGYPVRFVV